MAVVMCCSCMSDDNLEQALRYAGPNRAELESVLHHYRSVDIDPQKLQAAEFLIENMPGHYSYRTNDIEDYYSIALDLFNSELSPKEQRDSLLVLSENRFVGLDHKLVQDSKIITSEFLIKNIDAAFNVWRNERWAKHLTFEEFCEWLLPYKSVELQSFDNWRDTMSLKFSEDVRTMQYDDESYESPFRAINVIREELIRKIRPTGMYNKCGYPMLSAQTISNMTFGSCADYVNLGVLTFRSMGIPVIIDETPSWGRYRAGHSWYTLLNEHGEEMPSEWDISSCPGTPFFPYQRIPKVFRRTYSINRDRIPYNNESEYKYPFSLFSQDVTDRYFKTTDVTVDIRKHVNLVEDFAYIATFRGQQGAVWTLLDVSPIKKGKVTFQKMGRNILYFILGYDGKMLIPVSAPLIIHKDGSIETVNFNLSSYETETITIRRKYYSSENVVAMRNRLVGGVIEASNESDFRNATLHYSIEVTDIPDKIQLPFEKKYRYWRYLSPDGSYGSIAELKFFDVDTIPLEGNAIFSANSTQSQADNAFDDDWLSNFETGDADGNWIGIDMGRPVNAGFVRVVPRSDDNDIHPGDEYELKYWNGYFWMSVGEQIAVDNSLNFDSVPKDALLWLHDRTRGMDERLFRYNEAGIEWW